MFDVRTVVSEIREQQELHSQCESIIASKLQQMVGGLNSIVDELWAKHTDGSVKIHPLSGSAFSGGSHTTHWEADYCALEFIPQDEDWGVFWRDGAWGKWEFIDTTNWEDDEIKISTVSMSITKDQTETFLADLKEVTGIEFYFYSGYYVEEYFKKHGTDDIE